MVVGGCCGCFDHAEVVIGRGDEVRAIASSIIVGLRELGRIRVVIGQGDLHRVVNGSNQHLYLRSITLTISFLYLFYKLCAPPNMAILRLAVTLRSFETIISIDPDDIDALVSYEKSRTEPPSWAVFRDSNPHEIGYKLLWL